VISTSLWNRIQKISILLTFAALFLTGCDNPQKTADTLRKEIAGFKASPDEMKQLKIEQSFAKLEQQIAVVEKRGDDIKAAGLRDQLTDLRSDYQAAKMARALNDARNAIQGFGEAVKDGAKSIGDIFKNSGTNDN
jgi:predicted small secreted protein